MIRLLVAAFALLALGGCGPYPIISGDVPSFVRVTQQLHDTVLVGKSGRSVSVFEALSAGVAFWDKAGALVRVVEPDDVVNGPTVRAEMATSTEIAVDLDGGYSFAYYNSTEHVIKVNPDFEYNDVNPNDIAPTQGLQVILAHETGHAMGLPHLRDDQHGIMNATPWVGRTEVSQDDIDLFHQHWRGLSQ